MSLVPIPPLAGMVAARPVHNECDLGSLEDLRAANILAPNESAPANMAYAAARFKAREFACTCSYKGSVKRDQPNGFTEPFVCGICWKPVLPTDRIALIPIMG